VGRSAVSATHDRQVGQAGKSPSPCKLPDPWNSTRVSRRPPAPCSRPATRAWPVRSRPSIVRPASSPSSAAGPVRHRRRALHWGRPISSFQESTVAPGSGRPSNVTSRRAKRRCAVATAPTVTGPGVFFGGSAHRSGRQPEPRCQSDVSTDISGSTDMLGSGLGAEPALGSTDMFSGIGMYGSSATVISFGVAR